MKHWKILDFDTNWAIRPSFNFNKIWQQDFCQLQIGQQGSLGYWVVNRSHLDKFLESSWIKRFESQYYEIEYCYIFYKSKNFINDNRCHIDIDPNSNDKVLYALNWCHGIDDAYMVWYENFKAHTHITEQKNSKYIQDVNYNLLELDKKIIGSNLTLVNTAVPHNVLPSSKDRWSISLRLKKIDSIKTWDDAMSYFT